MDLDGGMLAIRRVLPRYGGAFHFDEPKTTRSRRTIEMPQQMCRALREHRARQIEERLRVGQAWNGQVWGDLVFCNEAGDPLHGTTVGKQFRAVVEQAQLPAMRYHDLRHGSCESHGRPRRATAGGDGNVGARADQHHHERVQSRGSGIPPRCRDRDGEGPLGRFVSWLLSRLLSNGECGGALPGADVEFLPGRVASKPA